MAEQPETRVVAAIVRMLEAADCVVVKMHGSAYMPGGFPDLLIIRPDGETVYLEVKVPGRTDGPAGVGLAAAQLGWLWRLGRQGCRVGWADSPASARWVLLGL